MSGQAFTTLSDAVARHATNLRTKEAFVTGDRRVSWQEFDAAASAMAAGLLREGVSVGARVALLLDDPYEFVQAFIAVLRVGGVVVPISSRMSNETVQRIVGDCEPLLSIVGAKYTAAEGGFAVKAMSIDTLTGVAAAPASQLPSVPPDADFSIVYSSGSTSDPKGVIHTHRARMAAAERDIAFFDLGTETRTLIATPLFTAMTWSTLIPTIYAGGTCILTSSFTGIRFFELIRRERPTLLKVVPTQLALLFGSPHFEPTDFRSVRALLFGGARADSALREKMWSLFPDIAVEVYGATECGPITCLRYADAHERGSVGRPLPGVRITIVDDNDVELPLGAFGNIRVSSVSLMRGYTRDDRGVRVVQDERVVKLGDIGKLDENGLLWHMGRDTDVIISGGFNVHGADLEDVLLRHPAVRDAAVVGKPISALGEAPVGFVTLRDDGAAKATDICQWANAQLNPTQRLYRVEVIRELPRTTSGKIAKRRLQEP